MNRISLRFLASVLGVALLLSGCNMLSSLTGPNDQAISSQIQAKLFQDPVLKTRDIRVTTQKGVVVLNGTVNTDSEKAAADQLVNGVPGVKQVIDQLSVAGPTAAPSESAQAPAPAPREARAEPAERPARRRAARAAEAPPAETASAAPAPAPPPPPAAAPAQPAAPPAPPPPPLPEQITIPTGTVVTVQMIDGINSSRNRPGDTFAATISSPVVIGNRVVIPQDSDARVRLVQSASAGHMTGRSELQVELVSVTVHGTSYPVESTYYEKTGASRGKRTAETVGGGAALGALLGAVIGHGKGAAIGAGVGAAAGTGVQAATKGQQVSIPSETKLDFTLKAPLTITM